MDKQIPIDLILKARLEAAEAMSGAENLGREMAKSFSQAFDSIGDEIAKKIAEAAKRSLSNATLDNSHHLISSRTKFAADEDLVLKAPTAPNPRSSSTADRGVAAAAGVITQPGPIAPTSSSPPPTDAADQLKKKAEEAQSSSVGQILSSGGYVRGKSGLRALTEILNQADVIEQGLGHGHHEPLFDQAKRESMMKTGAWASGLAKRAQTFVDLQRSGIDVEKDSYVGSKSEISDAQGFYKEQLLVGAERKSKLEDKIEELIKALSDNTLAGEKRTLAEKELIQRQEELDRVEVSQSVAHKELNKVNLVASDVPAEAPGFMQRHGRLLSRVAAGVGTLGMLPGMIRQSEAAYADASNLGSRALMDGDFNRMLSIKQQGGESAINYEALKESLLKSIGMVGGATIAGGVMTGGNPAAMGLAGGAAAIGAVANFGNTFRSTQESILNSDMFGTRKEYFRAVSAGRENAISSLLAGRELGNTGLSDYIGSANRPDLIEYAGSKGLSIAEMRGINSQLASAGIVAPNGEVQSGSAEAQKRMMELYSKGITSVPALSSTMLNYGSRSDQDLGRGIASSQLGAAELADRFGGYGLGSNLNSVLAGIAGQASQIGLGGFQNAVFGAEQSVATAQQAGVSTNPAAMQFLQQTQGGLMNAGLGGAGPAGLARVRAIKDLQEKYGVKLSEAEVQKLQSFTPTAEGLESMLRSNGYTGPKSGKGMLADFSGGLNETMLKQYTRFYGNEEKAVNEIAAENGAKTDQERDLVGKLVKQSKTPEEIKQALKEKSPFGQEQLESQTKVDAKFVSAGMDELGKVLPMVNEEFKKLIGNLKNQSRESYDVSKAPLLDPEFAGTDGNWVIKQVPGKSKPKN